MGPEPPQRPGGVSQAAAGRHRMSLLPFRRFRKREIRESGRECGGHTVWLTPSPRSRGDAGWLSGDRQKQVPYLLAQGPRYRHENCVFSGRQLLRTELCPHGLCAEALTPWDGAEVGLGLRLGLREVTRAGPVAGSVSSLPQEERPPRTPACGPPASRLGWQCLRVTSRPAPGLRGKPTLHRP